MSDQNKALTRRWFEEVWNRQRREAIDELAAPDAVTYGLASNPGPAGLAEFRELHARFLAAFPDIRMTVEDVIAEGDKTAVRIRGEATHTGDGLGVAPTGRRVDLSIQCLIRWRDGKIVEAWNEFDAYGMMQQLTADAAAVPVKIKA